MKAQATFTALLLAIAIGLFGQMNTADPIPHARLQWIAHNGKELTEKDLLSVSKEVTPHDRKALVQFFAESTRPGKKSHGTISQADADKIAAAERVKLIDLSGDGLPEVIDQAIGEESGCSPTGNCPFSVLEKNSMSYRTILGATGQVFDIEDTRSNSFQEIVIGMHGSARESELKVYQFRDGAYHRVGCYEANWSVLVNGEYQDVKEPVITKCGR